MARRKRVLLHKGVRNITIPGPTRDVALGCSNTSCHESLSSAIHIFRKYTYSIYTTYIHTHVCVFENVHRATPIYYSF